VTSGYQGSRSNELTSGGVWTAGSRRGSAESPSGHLPGDYVPEHRYRTCHPQHGGLLRVSPGIPLPRVRGGAKERQFLGDPPRTLRAEHRAALHSPLSLGEVNQQRQVELEATCMQLQRQVGEMEVRGRDWCVGGGGGW
jgi:hypothetical protein